MGLLGHEVSGRIFIIEIIEKKNLKAFVERIILTKKKLKTW